MRLELGGTLFVPKPVVLVYDVDSTLDIAAYVALGYKFFDVICVGAGGGRGGNTYGEDTLHAGTYVRGFGGNGGGGGYARFRGLLTVIGDSADIVVGTPGAPGTDSISESTFNPSTTTDGGNGGDSKFLPDNGFIYIWATGGHGGYACKSRSRTVSPESDGGAGGGSGGGGGAAGGGAATVSGLGAVTPGYAGSDGSINMSTYGVATGADEGRGGGGGPGGIENVDPGSPPTNGITRLPGYGGGRGCWTANNEGTYVDGTPALNDPDTGGLGVIPGIAGGARITPLNGSWKTYGRSGEPGVVAIRLTAV